MMKIAPKIGNSGFCKTLKISLITTVNFSASLEKEFFSDFPVSSETSGLCSKYVLVLRVMLKKGGLVFKVYNSVEIPLLFENV